MSKAKKIQEKKNATDRENARSILKKAEELGLGYVDTELPPDELEESQYKRSIFTSLMSMIPYTQAWYEASSAEEELDDLGKIRIERAKVDDLVAMTKMGRHEEALTKMMAETNNDFFYFNKLRTKMEAEGKIKVELPNLNPNSEMERGQHRNRLKKAQRMQFAFIDDSMMKQLSAFNKSAEDLGRPKKDAPCTWRGKSKEGVLLGCMNLRMRHPTNTYKENGEEFPEILLYCAHHIVNCIAAAHAFTEPVRIQHCNGFGLCTECFVERGKGKPPHVSKEAAAGVLPVAAMVSKASLAFSGGGGGGRGEGEDGSVHSKTAVAVVEEGSTCRWKPDDVLEKSLFGYRCTNKVIKNDNTGLFTPFCGYHVRACVCVHPHGSSDAIAVKNCLGLCSSHHIAKQGKPPKVLLLPYPGMDNPRLLKQELMAKAKHWVSE